MINSSFLYKIVCVYYRLGQACAHVGALLFLLSELVAEGVQQLPDGPACTDILCKWTQPKGYLLYLVILFDHAKPVLQSVHH